MSLAAPEGLNAVALADALERHGAEALALVVQSLRAVAADVPAASATEVAGMPVRTAGGMVWRQLESISGFEHVWPEVHEHYPRLDVFEGSDARGVVRLAIGKPRERMPVYGRERGWVAVWELVNGGPREQRAVFVESDDHATTGDHAALITGKGGMRRSMYAPEDRPLLPAMYLGMRVQVHRDRCTGRYAKNRLAVMARLDEPQTMLDHALANLRMRS